MSQACSVEVFTSRDLKTRNTEAVCRQSECHRTPRRLFKHVRLDVSSINLLLTDGVASYTSCTEAVGRLVTAGDRLGAVDNAIGHEKLSKLDNVRLSLSNQHFTSQK